MMMKLELENYTEWLYVECPGEGAEEWKEQEQ